MSVKFKSTNIPSMSIENAVSTMRTYLVSRGLSEQNIRCRVNAARFIMRKYGKTMATDAFFEKAKLDMIEAGKKPASINYVLYSLEYLAASQKTNIKIEKLRVTEYRKDFLSPEEARKLQNSANNVRDKAIIAVMLSGALRCKEIVNANVNDFNRVKRIFHIRDNQDNDIPYKGIKNKHEDIVILSKEAAQILDEYLKDRPILETNAMFVTQYGKRIHGKSIENIITKTRKIAGIERRVFPHLLRHTCITLMVKSNVNLALVSKQARHSDINMTMKYAHPTDDMIRSAIDQRPLF